MKEALIGLGAVAFFVTVVIFVLEWANQPSTSEIMNIKQALPAGCEFKDLGSYGDINHVVMVRCEGKTVSAISHREQDGKYSDYGLSIIVDG